MDCLGLLGNTLRRRRRTLSESKYIQQFQMPRKKIVLCSFKVNEASN
jgi:hypothetical protein